MVDKINEPENKKEHDENFKKILQLRKETDKQYILLVLIF
jgi:hypothetical protein